MLYDRGMKEQIAQLLHHLVSVPSVDGNLDAKSDILRFAERWLRENNVEVTVHDHPSHPSLIAKVPGEGKPVLLLSHLDVVPAPETMFVMRREGERVFGRGVLDDKGPSAMLMLLMASLAGSKDPHAAATLVLSTDEEIGSSDGVERLVREGLLDGHRCVIALDGGGEDRIVRREKGLLHLTLRATGKTAHNSTPWEGDNAVEKMLRVYDRLKRSLHEETTPEDRWKSSVSIGTVSGGKFVNQVPGHCEAKIDIRFTDARTLDQVRSAVDAAMEDGVTVLGAQGGHPFETHEDDPLMQSYARCMAASFDKPMKLVSEHGATDARFFRAMNIPIWLHYPDGGEIHTDDEWMDLASAEKLWHGMDAFLRDIA